MNPFVKKSANTLLVGVSEALRSLAGLLEIVAVQIDLKRTAAFELENRPDDIFVVTYPRSGTTLMQMMLYQLTTDGSMDFQHIGLVVPWYERRIMSDPKAAMAYFAAMPSPRVFKSHLSYPDTPKKRGKYIYVMRDGQDVLVSYYHFYCSHLSFRGTFEQFFADFMAGRVQYQSWFAHVRGWWLHGQDPDVLFLRYEEIIADLGSTIRKVADFCNLEIPADRLPIIQERCGFAFMKRHERQFDHTTGLALDRGYQLDAFIRKGKKGEGETLLTQAQKAAFESRVGQELAEIVGK
ncbi:MAG: sulfotransferase domain-containing protein [Magnetococcales bacterium]|nr:sulfotransferase domain-containing protein [Magnetococcales bacterium]MBF0439416.1 sulfotransferase domain-containing protein [Magnetococcales bacterium]